MSLPNPPQPSELEQASRWLMDREQPLPGRIRATRARLVGDNAGLRRGVAVPVVVAVMPEIRARPKTGILVTAIESFANNANVRRFVLARPRLLGHAIRYHALALRILRRDR